MSASVEQQWIEPYKGYKFKARQMTVEAVEQDRLIELCGIDPAIFGDSIDPSAFISLAIQEGVRNGIHANGTVNMGNRIIQHRQMRLGEPLTVTGEILDVEEVPRGKVAISETWFSGADGECALTSHRRSLRPDPARIGVRGAGEQPRPFMENVARMRVLGTFTLSPESVKAYTGPHNPIHLDPEAAKRGGFRAPIIGGGQGVRFLTAEIWRRFRPRVLDIEVQFRRPIFWDDTVTIVVDEQHDEWQSIGLMKGGKVATEGRINRIV